MKNTPSATQLSYDPELLTLSNGIQVVLQHFDGAAAATYWWVRTGSADERPKEAGFAHFLEHMLFKDASAKETGQASTGKMARTIESLGGDINAYTSFDQTVYHVTCAAHHWIKVIDAFGEMAKPQKFLKEDFEREREVILEELRKNEDSPDRQMFQSLFSKTFSKHPYGKPVIGFVKTLNAAKVQDLEAFYRRNYIPQKMGIVLVGPIHDAKGVRKKQILNLLEKRFGKKVLKPVKKVQTFNTRPTETELRKAPALEIRKFDVKQPSLSIAFRVPALSHDDIPALDVMSSILGMGELSRLYQHLFYKTSIATDASGGMYVPMDPGMLYFQMEVDSLEKITQGAREMFSELRRIREHGPSPEELARVIVNSESEKLYATQTVDGTAGRLGFMRFIVDDMSFDDKYLAKLRAVDSAQIQAVAHKYLDHHRMSIVALIPKEQSFDLTEIAELAKLDLDGDGLGAATQAVHAKKHRKVGALDPASLPVETFKLSSGIRVAHFERPQSHVFSVHACVLGGLRLELASPIDSIEKDWGTSHLMSMVWAKGTQTRDSRQIAGIVEGHAAGLDGFSGRNSSGVQLTGLKRDWMVLSDLLTEVLLEPSFPKEEVDLHRKVVMDSIKSIEDHSSQLCSKLFLETLYEKHPYGKIISGSLESLPAIDSHKLRAFHRAWMRPERLVIAVSGAISRSALEAWLVQLEARSLKVVQGARAMALPTQVAEESALKAPRWVEKNLNREQAHIIVGGLGISINSEDRYSLRLLQTLLGGQSGRLFIELREKKSLAYTVSPLGFEGLERGYLGTYIACSPGKRAEATQGIKTVLEKLAERGPTSSEMKRAQEFFLGRRAMDLQSDGSIASHYGLEELYEMERLSEAELIKTVRKISAREIQDVCRKYLVEPHQVTAVVG